MMKNKITIGKRSIGHKEPIFIIAEAGVNHNGDLRLAKKMIDAAQEAGADAIKFQTFDAGRLVTGWVERAKYQMTTVEKSQHKMLKKLELSKDDFKKILAHCKNKNIIFLSTPYDEKSADFLEELGVSAFKVASSDITNIPFLIHLAKKRLPLIVSTGASYLKEVKEAVSVIKKSGNKKIVLLHCTAAYPTKMKDVNLRAMLTLKKEFDSLLIGYSDHTLGMIAPIVATVLGANVLEKHFTLDRKLSGPDHKASLEPCEFKEMVQSVRGAEAALGSFVKKPTIDEEEDRQLGRRSIVADSFIARGDRIKKSMLAIKRPGTGISPKYLNKVVGKIAKSNIKKDRLIKWSDLI